MTDDPYVYPGTAILINKLGLRDLAALERFERRAVAQRSIEGVPNGDFGLIHLRAIHQHLFQDLYDWAGKIRIIDIAKGDQRFQTVRFIETGMKDVHRRMKEKQFLRALSPENFAREAGIILGDVDYVHPFREGNGRTQLQYLKQLAGYAGHIIALTRLDAVRWHGASRLAHDASYDALAECISEMLPSK